MRRVLSGDVVVICIVLRNNLEKAEGYDGYAARADGNNDC